MKTTAVIGFVRALGMATILILTSSCGGGGGGGGGGDSGSNSGSQEIGSDGTPRYSIAGTVTLPDTAAIDNDTNDSTQPGWAGNDTSATAQSLSTPVQLVGYLNMPGQGPAGKTYAAGDQQDIFKVNLLAGQVVELSLASNTAENDIDLTLFDVATGTSATPVGASSSTGTRECISITRDGSYFVVPWIVKGAAMYTLHISAANDGTTCANGMSSKALFAPGELVAKVSGPSFALLNTSGKAAAPIPQLLSVPTSAKLLTSQTFAILGIADQRDADIEQALNTLRYAKALMASGNYAYVEPNFIMEPFSSYAPNDPNYADQLWNYTQISLPDAMDRINSLSVTNPAPIVAVIDYAFLATHPELADHIVDPYSFLNSGTESGVGSNPSENHGTLVSGFAVATANNGLYGAGVAPMAKLMPIRFSGNDFQAAHAILYAAGLPNASGTVPARKADVINMSWGTITTCSALFGDVMAQARTQNVVLVAATGNTDAGKLTPPVVASPANCPGVIAVGASTVQKNRAAYSNYGPALTLTAPGGDPDNNIYGSGLTRWGGTYGTSFAAPQVAGVIALMRYVAPGITPPQIDTLIATGRLTDDLGVAGRDDEFGQGMINALKAVNEARAFASGTDIPGAIVASPASLSFGSTLSSARLKLNLTASGSEVVSSITTSSPAITITPASSVNATNKLGDYTISVDRSKLPVGASYPVLTVMTSARSFSVPITVVKLAATSKGTGTAGSILIRATNLATTTSYSQRVTPMAGVYTWRLTSMRGGTYVLNASTDLDNDGNYCEPGEGCGDYPGNGQTFIIDSNKAGLDFSMSPSLNTASTP